MSSMYHRIEELCRNAGTNITAMCRELQISRSSLSELKAGRTKTLSMKYTARICRYFQIPMDVLLDRNESSPALPSEQPPGRELREAARLLQERPQLKRLVLLCREMPQDTLNSLISHIETTKRENSGVEHGRE